MVVPLITCSPMGGEGGSGGKHVFLTARINLPVRMRSGDGGDLCTERSL